MPIHTSHIASSNQAFVESGGMTSAPRPPRADVTPPHACHRCFLSFHIGLRGFGSSIVITRFAPVLPQGGGGPSPTRMVITGWRRVFRPWCLAVGDDDKEVDWAALALGEPAEAKTMSVPPPPTSRAARR